MAFMVDETIDVSPGFDHCNIFFRNQHEETNRTCTGRCSGGDLVFGYRRCRPEFGGIRDEPVRHQGRAGKTGR